MKFCIPCMYTTLNTNRPFKTFPKHSALNMLDIIKIHLKIHLKIDLIISVVKMIVIFKVTYFDYSMHSF